MPARRYGNISRYRISSRCEDGTTLRPSVSFTGVYGLDPRNTYKALLGPNDCVVGSTPISSSSQLHILDSLYHTVLPGRPHLLALLYNCWVIPPPAVRRDVIPPNVHPQQPSHEAA